MWSSKTTRSLVSMVARSSLSRNGAKMSTVASQTLHITFVDREVSLEFALSSFCAGLIKSKLTPIQQWWSDPLHFISLIPFSWHGFLSIQGNRARVPALVGQSLLQVAQDFKVDIEGGCAGGAGPQEIQRTESWREFTFGEGPSCYHCHVQIPSQYNHLLEPYTYFEQEGLNREWEAEATATSRLACQITLGLKHDGMVVYVPDAPVVSGY